MFGMTLEQNSKKELARAINTLTNKLYTLACKIATPLKTIQLIQFVDVAPMSFFSTNYTTYLDESPSMLGKTPLPRNRLRTGIRDG